VIIGFKHKGLEKFFGKGTKSGIQVKHAQRLRLILGRLSVSRNSKDMALPGLNLRGLTGARKGTCVTNLAGTAEQWLNPPVANELE